MVAILEEAVHDLQRKKFWEAFQAACEAVQGDRRALARLRVEDVAWDSALADGFEHEPTTDLPKKRKRAKSGGD